MLSVFDLLYMSWCGYLTAAQYTVKSCYASIVRLRDKFLFVSTLPFTQHCVALLQLKIVPHIVLYSLFLCLIQHLTFECCIHLCSRLDQDLVLWRIPLSIYLDLTGCLRRARDAPQP